ACPRARRRQRRIARRRFRAGGAGDFRDEPGGGIFGIAQLEVVVLVEVAVDLREDRSNAVDVELAGVAPAPVESGWRRHRDEIVDRGVDGFPANPSRFRVRKGLDAPRVDPTRDPRPPELAVQGRAAFPGNEAGQRQDGRKNPAASPAGAEYRAVSHTPFSARPGPGGCSGDRLWTLGRKLGAPVREDAPLVNPA